jgi:hypothetical protein
MASKLEADQSRASILIWERRRKSFVAFVETDFVLNVKPQAGQPWEWLVRRPGQLPVVAKGMAATVHLAMRDAEQATVALRTASIVTCTNRE